MEGILTTFGLVFAFVLRLGIPIGVTLLIGWYLRRLDSIWKDEAEQQALEGLALEGSYLQGPCWKIMDCPPTRRDNCAAFQNPEISCWESRKSNGHIQPACKDCQVWKEALRLASLQGAEEKTHA